MCLSLATVLCQLNAFFIVTQLLWINHFLIRDAKLGCRWYWNEQNSSGIGENHAQDNWELFMELWQSLAELRKIIHGTNGDTSWNAEKSLTELLEIIYNSNGTFHRTPRNPRQNCRKSFMKELGTLHGNLGNPSCELLQSCHCAHSSWGHTSDHWI
jgi:hypothetical protein